MTEQLNWGIISTGHIAHTFAKALQHCDTGRLAAVASRSDQKAREFAEEFGIETHYGSYEQLLDDATLDAVYIAVPHPFHAEWAIKAARASKHILCEKPLALNYPQAMAVVEAAREAGVFLMEAFMYRCHPQTARLVELVREGAIGEVRVIDAVFSFHATLNKEARLFNPDLGGGGILDVGCYPVSMARLLAGATMGRPFADPVGVSGAGHVGVTGVDEWASGTLEFEGGIVARISCGIALEQESVVRVYGSAGSILVESPWIVSREGGASRIILKRHDNEKPEEILITSDKWLYTVEADTVAANIDSGQAPAMPLDDTLGNMRTLDRWREAVGVVYPAETISGLTKTLTGEPLAVRGDSKMRFGAIDDLSKPVSLVVMGTMAAQSDAHAAALYDDFFERGGNTFDTGYVYGGGKAERRLGQWVANKGLRERVVILGKGAHTPCCNPTGVTRQLRESLERLQTSYLDIYMLHRDNPDIPVGEFVDVLNDHVDAGDVRCFGASNWSLERLKAAQDWAAANGKTGFAAISNNLSLAEMVAPVWEGCVSASEEMRKWLAAENLANFAWSSQARGFFTDRSSPEDLSDAGLVHSWYSEENFERKRRAEKLGRDKGVSAINVALAWVLGRDFPSFALIGPENVHETATSLCALDVELSKDEMRWLDLLD